MTTMREALQIETAEAVTVQSDAKSMAEAAEAIGYMRAMLDVMSELNDKGMGSAARTIALLCRAKGVAK